MAGRGADEIDSQQRYKEMLTIFIYFHIILFIHDFY